MSLLLSLAAPSLLSTVLAQNPDEAAEEPKPAAADATDEKPRVGQLIRIAAPINDRVDSRVKRAVSNFLAQAKDKGEWPVIMFEFEPGRSEFGGAFDLARFLSSAALNGATTVAYVPETLTGHAVLVVMACDEIVMSPTAEIGKAGESETVIEPSVRNAYAEIAERRKTIPADVAIKMLDPATELLVVETEVSREYVLRQNLDELKKQKAIESEKVLLPAGRPGIFSGTEAREMGLVSYLASDRLSMAKALGLSRDAIKEDPSLDGEWRTVRIDVKGLIQPRSPGQWERLIEDQIRDREANFICLWIDSPGGSPIETMELANMISSLDPGEQRTVAFIEREARGDAAFLALACDQIVMYPSAVLGGDGEAAIDEGDRDAKRVSLADLAKRKSRNVALAEAMVDPTVEVFRYTRRSDGLIDYYTQEEAAALHDADQWTKGAQVTTPGHVLQLTGDKADELGVAFAVVNNVAEFRALNDLENDPVLVAPGWADLLVDALNSPGVSWFLFALGLLALYVELHTPGVGLGGLVALVCFVLFFWLAFLGGTSGWLEVLLFVLGVLFLLIEIFVFPGMGVFGLGGGLLVILSLILASQTFILPRNEYQMTHVRNTMLMIGGSMLGVFVGAVLIRRFLPHAPGVNRMLLSAPTRDELSDIARREALARFDHLVGAKGTTFTRLSPSGKAMIAGELFDVMSSGEFIERDAPIEVVEARGNRIVVRSADA